MSPGKSVPGEFQEYRWWEMDNEKRYIEEQTYYTQICTCNEVKLPEDQEL
jgi:hypothetical protein